jgi:RNA polymerase sigma-70 factor (ECF subfamily)
MKRAVVVERGPGIHIPAGINSRGGASDRWSTLASVSEDFLLPHLDAAYNLARWMMGNDADAEDVVQEACVRALAALDRFRGGDRRAWLLAIVRNGCYSAFRGRRGHAASEFDESAHLDERRTPSPERLVLEDETARRVQAAVAALSPEFREAIVLREFEGLSYKEIAAVVAVPIGTVMSRLARARAQLQQALGGDR